MNAGSRSMTDVCLILEGSYPYVAGGVSTWVQDLIKAQAPLRFSIVALVADAAKRTPRYELPENVDAVVDVPLSGPPRRGHGSGRDRGLAHDLAPLLLDIEKGAGLASFQGVVERLRKAGNRLGSRRLMNSEAAWSMITAMYDEIAPESSFLEFFWTWRALHGGLFAVLLCPLPRARVYHTISTGYAGLVAARAAIQTRRPAVLTEHGIYTNERRIEITMAEWLYDAADDWVAIETPRWDLRQLWMQTFQSYARICYESCTEITTLFTGNQRLQLADGAPSDRLRVIPNGIDVAMYGQIERSTEARRPCVALIGRVVPIKDIKTYIRAIDALRRKVPDVEALILGPDDEDEEYAEECRALVEYLQLQGTVSFLGRVRIADYLGRIDVLALTSVSEAQPLVILEAGAAGIPTVATDVGACREMIEGPDTEAPHLGPGGAVVGLSSPIAAAEAMSRLLIDRDWWERCSRAIRERVDRSYNKTVIDQRYGELYQRMIAAADAGPPEPARTG